MNKKISVFVGTYSCPILFGTGETFVGKGEGIYHFSLDMDTAAMQQISVAKGVKNPSYIVINNAHTMLYAVNELEEYNGEESGAVSSFRLINGELEFVNAQPSYGTDPCHVAITPDGTHLCVSNYMSGSLSVYPIMSDGAIGTKKQFMQHKGHGSNPSRQKGPHCHSTVFSPDGKFAFVVELGTDRLLCYHVNAEFPVLTPALEPEFFTGSGAGPRVCCFDNAGKHAYVANELNNTVSVLLYNVEQGLFKQWQTISTLPSGVRGDGCAFADIHLTPDGNFLYGTNRGHNSIVCYSVDASSGTLTYVGCQPCGGVTPRNFAIDSTGRYLLCANQDTDNIIVFRIDAQSGALEILHTISVGSPVCIRMYS